jgi:hypothetical protein
MEVTHDYAPKTFVSLQDTPHYHLIGRCVRRSWLCGFDQRDIRVFRRHATDVVKAIYEEKVTALTGQAKIHQFVGDIATRLVRQRLRELDAAH